MAMKIEFTEERLTHICNSLLQYSDQPGNWKNIVNILTACQTKNLSKYDSELGNVIYRIVINQSTSLFTKIQAIIKAYTDWADRQWDDIKTQEARICENCGEPSYSYSADYKANLCFDCMAEREACAHLDHDDE